MKRVLIFLLCLIMLMLPLSEYTGEFSAFSGGDYSYTGHLEEGKLAIWLSPEISRDRSEQAKLIDDAANRVSFYEDIEFTRFSDRETFFRTLSLSIMSGEGPDVVISAQEEWSPKFLETGMMLDLEPFFEDCFRQNIIDKSTLVWDLFEESKVDGSLYLAPLWFTPQPISLSGAEDPLDLSGKPPFDRYVEDLSLLSGDDRALSSASLGVSDPMIAFPDLIDYKYYDTRLEDPAVQEYIKLYLQTLCAVENIGPGDAYQDGYGDYLSSSQVDRVTEAGSVTPAFIPVCVGVTANTPRLQKALAYLESLFGEEWAIVRSGAYTPFSVFRSVLPHALNLYYEFSQESVDMIVSAVLDRDYRVIWADGDVRDMLDAFYQAHLVMNEDTNLTVCILPTRDEFADLHRRICKLLGE